MAGKDLVGLIAGDLADEEIPPANLGAMSLELDRARARSGRFRSLSQKFSMIA